MSSIYNNPELEMMAKEIQAMLVEKLQIEKECQESYTNTDPDWCNTYSVGPLEIKLCNEFIAGL